LNPCYGASCERLVPGALRLDRLKEKASLNEGHGFSRAEMP
jgi:hypothetical protein